MVTLRPGLIIQSPFMIDHFKMVVMFFEETVHLEVLQKKYLHMTKFKEIFS